MQQPIPTGFSRILDPGALDRSGRRFFIALLVAVLVHAGLATIIPYRRLVPAPSRRSFHRIIRTDIIEIPAAPPDAPFIMERPRFVPRAIRPGIPEPGAGPEEPGASAPASPYGPSIPGELPYAYRPDLPDPAVPGTDDGLHPFFPGAPGTMEPPGRVIPHDQPLRGEMLRGEDFEWSREGMRTGMIEFNPGDKLAIRGIVPLPVVYSSSVLGSVGMQGLSDGIKKYTDLTVGYRRHVYLSESFLTHYPFIYLACSGPWEYHSWETRAVGEYLRRGGFAFLEANLQDEFDPAERVLRQFIKEALGPRIRLQAIPKDHPIYSCYFDFPEGPPVTSSGTRLYGAGLGRGLPWLEGAWIDGRLALVLSNHGYGKAWDSEDGGGAALRLGVNLLVYALRQEGGNAPKRHDYTLRPGSQAQRNIAGQELRGEVKPVTGRGNGFPVHNR